MSGIYIHIPICATRCIYCDFYSTTLRHRESQLVDALAREMEQRRDYLSEPVRTLYLGGGTPSQLGSHYLRAILDAVASRFDMSQCEEVTMEANPEDIAGGHWLWGASPTLAEGSCQATDGRLLPPGVSSLEINRVSMGVQSMVDDELRLLHRRHDSQRVRQAVALLRQAGIRNLSLDLMYGLPQQTLDSWAYSIEQVLALEPEHISAYNLMVEEGTPLHTMVERGELMPCDDDTCLAMAQLLRNKLREAGYQQYEISNYAKPGHESRHNSAYWQQTPYLGLGPGAHSYDGRCLRSWNAPDLQAYLDGHRDEEVEELTPTDLYNERVMLGLRTARGLERRLVAQMDDLVQSLIDRRLLTTYQAPASDDETGAIDYIKLTEKGLALADEVMRELMIV